MARLSLAQANKIIAVALQKGREMKLPPIGVAILDAGGHLVAMQREDGLSLLRVKICQAKAYSCVAMAEHTRNLGDRFTSNAKMEGFLGALNNLSGGQVISVAGGVMIKDEAGELIGAVGVSGAASQDDETCAVAGLEAAGFSVNLEG